MLARIWTDPRTRPYRPVYARYLRKLLAARPPAALPLPVRLEVHHAHPLRHHDPADGPGRVAAGEHLSGPAIPLAPGDALSRTVRSGDGSRGRPALDTLK